MTTASRPDGRDSSSFEAIPLPLPPDAFPAPGSSVHPHAHPAPPRARLPAGGSSDPDPDATTCVVTLRDDHLGTLLAPRANNGGGKWHAARAPVHRPDPAFSLGVEHAALLDDLDDGSWDAVLGAFEAHCLDQRDDHPLRRAPPILGNQRHPHPHPHHLSSANASTPTSIEPIEPARSPFEGVFADVDPSFDPSIDPSAAFKVEAVRLPAASASAAAAAAAAAASVQTHAARALRQLVLGRDDERARRRSDGADRARSRKKRTREGEDDEEPRASIEPEAKSPATATATASASAPAGSVAATYAARDPARWAACATTRGCALATSASSASALASVRGRASAAAVDDLARRLDALRARIGVEMDALDANEARLANGERHRSVPSVNAPDRRRDRDRNIDQNDGNDRSTSVPARAPSEPRPAARAPSEAREGALAVIARRFRECRFKILETFAEDADAMAAATVASATGTDRETRDRTRTQPTASIRRASPGRGPGDPASAPPRPSAATLAASRVVAGSGRRTVTDADDGTPEETRNGADDAIAENAGTRTVASRGRHSSRAREVLNAWLSDNFYPTESRRKPAPTRAEKLELAAETGLTPRQVGDWFVNARARIWKPEMTALFHEVRAEAGETERNQNAARADPNVNDE